VNLNISKKSNSRPKPAKPCGTGILLPPPPSGTVKPIPTATSSKEAALDDLDFGLANLSVDSKLQPESSSNQENASSGWAQF
jgi:hypothetical protein